jgi:hypothetical protein
MKYSVEAAIEQRATFTIEAVSPQEAKELIREGKGDIGDTYYLEPKIVSVKLCCSDNE